MLRVSPLLLLIALVSLPGRAVQSSDEQLRAEVVKFCASLQAAFDSGDHAKVIGHFQYGELLPPTESEYGMLGQLRFWEKPIREIQTRDDIIRVTFTMDPKSDSPAQFLTLEMIRGAGGHLLVKSSATPGQIEAARQRTKKQEFRGEVTPARSWPLLDRYTQESASAGANHPLPSDAQVFPLAELYQGKEAVLLAGVARFEELLPTAIRFEKKDGVWSLQQRLADATEIDALLRSPGVKIVRRQAGLPLDSWPTFVRHLLTGQAQNFREAEKRHDFKTCAAVVDATLVGFGLSNIESLLTTLRNPRRIGNVTMGSKAEQPDGRLLVTFDAAEDMGSKQVKFFLAREGGGWVIDEAYNRRARQTIGLIRTLGVSIEAYAADHQDGYPQANTLDALRSILEPTYVLSMPMADAWGTPIRFEIAKDRKSYRLISAGADRKFNPQSWATANQELADFAEDAVFENGAFVRMWGMSD